MKQQKISEVLLQARTSFKDAGKSESLVDAEWLLSEVTAMSRTQLQLNGDHLLTIEQQRTFEQMMSSRLAGKPLQYIMGSQVFYGYEFMVNENVLIPRFETEELVERAISWVKDHQATTLIDMCTGSGCIGLTVLKECTEMTGTLVDLSPEALGVASRNAEALCLTDRATLIQSDLYSSVPECQVDMILSNPPYIESSAIEALAEEVKCSEPYMALDGGNDGLVFYRQIIHESKTRLNKGGLLIFEIGYNQMEAVKGLFSDEGYSHIKGYQDMSGKDRIVLGMR